MPFDPRRRRLLQTLVVVGAALPFASRIASAAPGDVPVDHALFPQGLASGDPRPDRVLLGELLGVHTAAVCLVEGGLDPTRYHPAARLGYHDYTFVREVQELRRPKDPTGS